jgi:hypothetical protein
MMILLFWEILFYFQISKIINIYNLFESDKIDGGTWYPPQACRFLKLDHHLHSFVYKNEKSIIERECITLRIEPKNVLTIIFCVKERM